jgi:hypothetical protein
MRSDLRFTLGFFGSAGISPSTISTSSSSSERFHFRPPAAELGSEPLLPLPSLVETEGRLLGLRRTEPTGPRDRTEAGECPSRTWLLRPKVDCLAHRRPLLCHAPQFPNMSFSIALPFRHGI